ncbi:MAG: acyl-CoA dehydrogenase family protein [Desulfobacterales bacterium]|jgi:alkylation response protein AidB-like acyl-CoA dehydrogenase|nr:acyl-CoA dehydrogenase family protein [Desulfobacterales bacterium]
MELEVYQDRQILKDAVKNFIQRDYSEGMIGQLVLHRESLSEFNHQLSNLDITGICFPEKYGGVNLGPVETAIVVEELSRYAIDLGMALGLNLAAGMMVLRYGNESQKNHYLPGLISGEMTACIAYTEPFSLGDVDNINHRIVEENEHLMINTDAIYCEQRELSKGILLIPAKQGGEIVFALIPLTCMKAGEPVDLLGRKILGQIKYGPQEIRCGAAHLFGQGHAMVTDLMNWLKFFNTVCCVGNMRTVVEKAIQYAKEREQFGKPIGTFQAIQHLLVDAKIGLDCASLYGRWLAWLLTENDNDSLPITAEINMANAYVTEAYVNAVNTGMQVMGGFGYMEESHMERYARDARMTTYAVEDGFSQKMRVADALQQTQVHATMKRKGDQHALSF